jgi:5-methylcytosine-specific restriction endonuclease McrA
MPSTKKQVRAQFRRDVFQRDRYRCQLCGKLYSKEVAEIYLDAHHITNRDNMTNGGYVVENGVSLCKLREVQSIPSCHEKAEAGTISAEALYSKVGSSYNEAAEAVSRK